jgi:transcriptional antiterminator NusG
MNQTDGSVDESGGMETAAEGDAQSQQDGQPAQPSGPAKDWYVIQAYSGYENKVRLSLEERIRQAGMEDHFGEILIPKENVTQNRSGKKRVVSRSFYPGYIFVEMHLTDESWHLVKGTPKISGFIGGRHPSPVPQPEIDVITRQVEHGKVPINPKVTFESGDHVRVTEGAFANYTGTVEEVNPEKQKVRVLISVFGRATPVELDYAKVEKTV